MYKANNRSLQRYHKVHEIAPAYTQSESDYIPTAANMGMDEAKQERRTLILEKTRTEQELLAAKRGGRMRDVETMGLRIQTLGGRLSLINRRIKDLNCESSREIFREAVYELCPPDLLKAIQKRCEELRKQAHG